MVEILDDVGQCVDAVLRRVGPRVVLALPLGIGKPNPLANEFYRRALREPGPRSDHHHGAVAAEAAGASALERRLLEPLVQRVFGSYVEPEYARASRGHLPPNVRIIEFFLTPGRLPRRGACAAATT